MINVAKYLHIENKLKNHVHSIHVLGKKYILKDVFKNYVFLFTDLKMAITYRAFFEEILVDTYPTEDVEIFQGAVKRHLKTKFTKNQMKNIKVERFIETFTTTVRRHWHNHKARKNKIYKQHRVFYSKVLDYDNLPEILVPEPEEQEAAEDPPEPQPMEFDDVNVPPPVQRIRSFSEKSKMQQIRDRAKVMASGTPNAVISSAKKTFYERGQHEAGYVVAELMKDPVETGKYLKDKLDERKSAEPLKTYSPEEGWALLVDRNYSVRQYKDFRRDVNAATGRKVYPSYEEVLRARVNLHPDDRYIIISENDAIVELQGVCDHTARRIFEIPGVRERARQLREENGGILILILDFKFGCDGFSGCTKFRQVGAEASHDGHVQASHFVVLQITTMVNGERKILYTNPLCNSSISCRLLRFWYIKESEDTLKEELNRLKEEEIFLDDLDVDDGIKVTYNGILSLLDQKALNALVGNRCQKRCPLCGLLPREYMADGEIIYHLFPGAISYLCLSLLHFGLRTVENLLKIGFHKYFKQNCCYEKNLPLKEKAIKEIQQAFLKKGLRVSMVCKEGGTTNTGKYKLNL